MSNERRIRVNLLSGALGANYTAASGQIDLGAALPSGAVPDSTSYLPIVVGSNVLFITGAAISGSLYPCVGGMEGSTDANATSGDDWLHGPTAADLRRSPADLWGGDLGYDLDFSTDGSSLPSDWAWRNQGSATWATVFGAGVLSIPDLSGSENIRGIERAFPTESTWKATLHGTIVTTSANYSAAGLTIRQSSDGKLYRCVVFNPGDVGAEYWTSETAYSSSIVRTSNLTEPASREFWLQLERASSTSYQLRYSRDGRYWFDVGSAFNPTTNLSGTIDKMGIIGSAGNSNKLGLTVHSFTVR